MSLPIVLEGTFKMPQLANGPDAPPARYSRFQVLKAVSAAPVPNASAITYQLDLYETRADYEAGKNPMPNPYPAFGIVGEDLNSDAAQTAFAALVAAAETFAGYLATLPLFNAEMPAED